MLATVRDSTNFSQDNFFPLHLQWNTKNVQEMTRKCTYVSNGYSFEKEKNLTKVHCEFMDN